jgi:hypothetical protein
LRQQLARFILLFGGSVGYDFAEDRARAVAISKLNVGFGQV